MKQNEIRNIYFRAMNQAGKKAFEEEEAQTQKDETIQKALDTYLKEGFNGDVTPEGRFNYVYQTK